MTLDIDLFGPATWKILHGRLGQQVGDLVEPLDKECLYALEKELPLSQGSHALIRLMLRTTIANTA
jgi:hypothetical protein